MPKKKRSLSGRRYDFLYRCSISREVPRGPYSGTLRSAISAAKRSGCKIVLMDSQGFRKGFVDRDGQYRLQ